MATFTDGPLSTHLYFPAHYLVAWLGVYFPWTVGLSRIEDVPKGEILLRRFSYCDMANPSFGDVVDRLLNSFDIDQGMYRFPCKPSEEDIIKKPHEELSREETDFMIALLPCVLPSREGAQFWVPPYIPHGFARQFGFDQGRPVMPPEFPRSCREAGVGTAYWFTIWSRFQHLVRKCDVFFPSPVRPVQITYNYAWWYGTQARRDAIYKRSHFKVLSR